MCHAVRGGTLVRPHLCASTYHHASFSAQEAKKQLSAAEKTNIEMQVCISLR